MKIDKQYGIWWETTTKNIQNEYRRNIFGLNIYQSTMMVLTENNEWVPCTEYYFADTIEEIESKILELGLIEKSIKENSMPNF
jgi:hypothetical protein